jgi:hypothetical protein
MKNVVTTRSGENTVVKAANLADVEEAAAELVRLGGTMVGPTLRLGPNWIATVRDPVAKAPIGTVTITNIGLQFLLEGPSRELVSAKVEEMTIYGSVLIAGPEEMNGKWVAVIDRRDVKPKR